jgi:3-isopropylmalate/(R)-2-methylmalate dehydratase small subunit
VLLEGRIWRLGDHVDTDAIIAARHLSSHRIEDIARHCLEDLRPGFSSLVSQGDIIAAGVNFGCGSSREHAPLVIRHIGIAAVLAESFSRIFFRNAINIGLPVVTCPEGVKSLREGDVARVDLDAGTLTNLSTSRQYPIEPFPPFILELLECGGLIPYLKRGGNRWNI